MSNLYKDAPIVKVVMLKGKDGAKSKLSELTNDMTFLTEEQIITLVTNIVDSGSVGDIDTGFVTRLVEQNKHKALRFWVGTQSEYNAIAEKLANTFYIITDDSFKEDVQAAIVDLQNQINNIVHTDYETEISDLQETAAALTTSLTTLQGKVTALESVPSMVYKKNDVENFKIQGAGYITNNKSEVHFEIPLAKYLRYSSLQFDLSNATIEMNLRQGGYYFHGTPDGPESVSASRVSFTTGNTSESNNTNEGCFSILATIGNGGSPFMATNSAETLQITNNAPVGITVTITGAKVVEV